MENWSTLLSDAREALTDAQYTFRDDLDAERKLRLEAIDRAEQAIARAKELLAS